MMHADRLNKWSGDGASYDWLPLASGIIRTAKSHQPVADMRNTPRAAPQLTNKTVSCSPTYAPIGRCA